MRTRHYLILTILLGNIFVLQGISQNKSQLDQNALPAKNISLKLTLNSLELGTTADTSILSSRLTEILDQRPSDNRGVYLLADRSVSAEEIAKLFGALNSSGAASILIPAQLKSRKATLPPADLLLVYAGSDGPSRSEMVVLRSGIEIGFTGELFENLSSAPPDLGVTAIVAQKDGTYRIEGKQVSASNLKIAIANRLKTKVRNRRILLIQAENYGSIEDVAPIAASAGAIKIYLVTKNVEHREIDMSFSLPPAFRKDKNPEETLEDQSVSFSGLYSSSFEIKLVAGGEGFDKERTEAELKIWYDSQKKTSGVETSLAEIDGSSGVLTIQNDKDIGYSATWFGSRKKDGKHQLVMIDFNSGREESKYSRYEFLQIMKSIKFN